MTLIVKMMRKQINIMKYKDQEITFDIDSQNRLTARFSIPTVYTFQGTPIKECVEQIKESIDKNRVPLEYTMTGLKEKQANKKEIAFRLWSLRCRNDNLSIGSVTDFSELSGGTQIFWLSVVDEVLKYSIKE
jgi:hypothetical protein